MKKRVVLLAVLLAAGIGIGLRIQWVNEHALQQKVQYYEMGEWVPLDGDYISVANENTEGYSIRVKSARVVPYPELVAEYNETESYMPEERRPVQVIDLSVEMKNEGKSGGHIFIFGYALQSRDNRSLLRLNTALWGMVTPQSGGDLSFGLIPDSIVKPFHLPFAPTPAETKRHGYDVNTREYDLVISLYPVKKMIHLDLTKEQ